MKKLFVILAALGILCAAAANGSSAPDASKEAPESEKSYEIGVPSPEKFERRLGDIKDAAADLASDFSVRSMPADESTGGRTIIIRFGSEE